MNEDKEMFKSKVDRVRIFDEIDYTIADVECRDFMVASVTINPDNNTFTLESWQEFSKQVEEAIDLINKGVNK